MMSIRVSIYDFFAYTIPGGIILAVVVYIARAYQVFSLNFTNISTLELLGMGILAYLVGYIIDPFAKDIWYRFFCPNDIHQTTLNDFNKRHPSIEIPFQKMDWYISFAYIKKCSVEMTQELEHLKVIGIMLRNSSFGVLIFGIVFLIEFLTHNFLLTYALASIVCLTTAIVLVKQAVKFHEWFHAGIFQSLVALISEPKKISTLVKNKSKNYSTEQHKDE